MKNDRGGGLDKKEDAKEGWIEVVKGSKITKKAYATLGTKFLAKPGPINQNIRRCTNTSTSPPISDHSVFKAKATARHKSKTAAYIPP